MILSDVTIIKMLEEGSLKITLSIWNRFSLPVSIFGWVTHSASSLTLPLES